jgi:outer membrane receptor protein involved in Fe transport
VTRVVRSQIEALGADDIADVLRMVPGVHVDEAGGRGGVSSIYVRGGEPNYTLFTLDGLPLNDPTGPRGGSFDLALLGTEDVERVEVARGVVPVSWGSAAMAGVVNVVTRRGRDAEAGWTLEASGGRDGYHRESLATHGESGAFDWRLGWTWLDEGVPVSGSELTSQSGRATLGWSVSDALRLRAGVSRANLDRESFSDASGGPRFAGQRAVETRDTDWTAASLRLEHDVSDRTGYALDLGLFDQREDLATPFLPDPSNPFASRPAAQSDTDFTRNTIRAHAHTTPTDAATLRAGLDLRYERGSSRGRLDLTPFFMGQVPTRFSLDRDVVSPFAELEIRPLPGLTLRAGARHEMSRGEDNEFLPRLGLVYALGDTTTLRASWGRGFKLPSFYALADPVVGNPRLASERSESGEIGVVQTFWRGDAFAELTLFRNEFDDLIDFDFATFSLVNRARVITRGVELALGARLSPRWAISVNGTHVRYDLDPGPDRLRGRPEWRGAAIMRWRPHPRLHVTLSGMAVGSVPDESLPTGPIKLDPWARADLTLRWQALDPLELELHIENLLDSEYQEIVGFDGPGFSARVGARVRF